MSRIKVLAIVAMVVCAALIVSLVGATIHFTTLLDQKDTQIVSLTETVASRDAQISTMQIKIESDNATIKTLNEQLADVQEQLAAANKRISDLEIAINGSESGRLGTLIFHVCEKGNSSDFGHLPNVTYTYNLILNHTDGYNVLLLPEYEGNRDWSETYNWLIQNFTGIPIALSAFEGGTETAPLVKLSISEISHAVQTLDVKMIRLSELVTYYLNISQPLPTEWITDVLSYCRTHNLKVFWGEWGVGFDIYQSVAKAIEGYEDIVTVAFQTNNDKVEPVDGLIGVKQNFEHRGASVQSWYWVERGYGNSTDMPAQLFVQHALTARNLGAEMLQFEPYWHLFNNDGESNGILELLETMVL
jgi:hypothetical protein